MHQEHSLFYKLIFTIKWVNGNLNYVIKKTNLCGGGSKNPRTYIGLQRSLFILEP